MRRHAPAAVVAAAVGSILITVATAMRPIEERIRYESYRCDVFDKIKDDVEAYTRDHLDRFAPASAEDAHCK